MLPKSIETDSGSNEWQVQTQYTYDFALHSVTPVKEEVALANLQPAPGEFPTSSVEWQTERKNHDKNIFRV